MVFQHRDNMDRYRHNVEIDDYLQIWEWCSRLLHMRWYRKPKLRNPCFFGLALALSDEREVKPMDLLKTYETFPFPFLDRDRVETFWEACPVSVLELCLGVYTKASPLAQPLNDLRSSFGENSILDDLAKKMRCREKHFGDDWFTEGHHPDKEYRLLVKEMSPICEAIGTLIEEAHATVSALALDVLALGWQRNEVPLAWLIRKTPENLFNKTTRILLWRAGREVLKRNLRGRKLEIALEKALQLKLSPAMKAYIESQGYTVDDAVWDFINYDLVKSREQLSQ
jgi:hypothetical protein